jgi:topoisomerase-4 subunit A
MSENEELAREEANKKTAEESGKTPNYVSGMYRNWFLEYASYVILERAVPLIYDGLKPVHRRILHSMRRMEDGRYNKVANIIGHTMQFHPHGDASIGDALVQLGQKELLIDMQGNWGNLYTGDGAAAPRYIEARLSKFALEVVFNPKTTDWKLSYDGRNKEPISLPVKFPLLLAQGVEGIAVGLASKILPHNFIELIHASIAYLKGEEFELYPDFPTGGLMDASKYNDGQRGGKVRVRARIEKRDKKMLVITELPFGKTTTTLIESIIAASEKEKINIKKVDDNTSDKVEILIHLPPNVSPDKTIDALYAFTDCEVSISPNSCVIEDDRPIFPKMTDMLRVSTDHTKQLLKRELEIRLQELENSWHNASLEKIFIENRIYIRIEDCETWEAVIATIDEGLEPFKKTLRLPVTHDDIVRLTEIKIKRISKFDAKKADNFIKGLEEEMEQVKHNLLHLVAYSIAYFTRILDKFSKGKERKTEIRNFDVIEATKVVVRNEKLYVNKEEGFMGTSLKKDEFVSDCADIDDVIIFRKDGSYLVTKVANKVFVGKNILHIAIFQKNDERTIYNAIYRDGETGIYFIKRFFVTGITRDKEYQLTTATKGSRVLYFTANPNGEAEVVKVFLMPKARIRHLTFQQNFSDIAIKGRSSRGNILTKNNVHRIVLKEEGVSTLGGREIWWDQTVLRLNAEGRGTILGEFSGADKILVVTGKGEFRTCSYDLNNHFEDNILKIQKFESDIIYSVAYFDSEQGFYYLKRFKFEESENLQSFIGEHPNNKLLLFTDNENPQLLLHFGGRYKSREAEPIDVVEFIGEKSFRAKGKRITHYDFGRLEELQPKELPEDVNDTDDEMDTNED